MCSLGYCHTFLLATAGVDELKQLQPIHTSGRQQKSMTIPKAAHTVL
jgi:ABC-type histidine transport system ATPase subunit